MKVTQLENCVDFRQNTNQVLNGPYGLGTMSLSDMALLAWSGFLWHNTQASKTLKTKLHSHSLETEPHSLYTQKFTVPKQFGFVCPHVCRKHRNDCCHIFITRLVLFSVTLPNFYAEKKNRYLGVITLQPISCL